MRKIIYAISVSLDGYIEDQNGEIGWTAPSEELHTHFNEREKGIDTHLYGRNVYEIMKFWEEADQNAELPEYMRKYARIWQQQRKIVFSTTLDSVEDGYELRNKVDPMEVKEWKNEPGKNIFAGGANLAASLMQHNLLDEIHLYIRPVLLGGGKPVFAYGKERELELIEQDTFPDDVVMMKYHLKS